MTHFEEYSVQAYANTEKPASELRKGDFIYTTAGGGKDCNFMDLIEGHERYNCGRIGRLCQIVAIVDVAEDFELLNNWMSQEAPEHRGGSQSDDVPDDKKNLTSEDYATFYDLVTVYRKPSGKWLAVDCQGYDYWRYVHLPMNYTAIFADEYAIAVATLDAKEAARKAAKEAELKAHAEEYAARVNELRAKYSALKENPADGRQVGANVRKFLKMHFPGIKFKVSARAGYWRDGYDVEVEAPKDTPEEVRAQISEVCAVWRETLKTGEMWDDHDGYGEYEASACPMDMYGRINYRIKVY